MKIIPNQLRSSFLFICRRLCKFGYRMTSLLCLWSLRTLSATSHRCVVC